MKRGMTYWWGGWMEFFPSLSSICSLFRYFPLELHPCLVQNIFIGVNTPPVQGEGRWSKSCQSHLYMLGYVTQSEPASHSGSFTGPTQRGLCFLPLDRSFLPIRITTKIPFSNTKIYKVAEILSSAITKKKLEIGILESNSWNNL